ncbi:MAG: hypothetical protein IT269_10250 [Saprospiraceae bacterium]|nr:hypothetical protein [Saprospiraceae bacterium]
MKDTHVVELIKALHPDELDDLRRFSTLGWVEKGDYARYAPLLLEILLKAYPDFEAENIEKNSVYDILFPGQPFVSSRLEKINVEAAKIIRTFLQVKYYLREENEFNRNLDMVVIFRNRGMSNRYEQWFSRLQKKLSQDIPFTENHFFHQYLLNMEQGYWMSLHNQQKNDMNLSNTIKSLDAFFYYQRLMFLNFLMNQNIIANCITNEELKKLSNYTHESTQSHHPLMRVALIHQSLLHNIELMDINNVDEAMQVLRQEEKSLSSDQLQTVYSFLRNLCAMLYNRGLPEAIERLHALQVISLEKNYLTHFGQLTPSVYLNLAKTALLCNKTQWAEQFIEDYKGRVINENDTFDFYRLNRAVFLFETGHFDAALDVLPAVFSQIDHMLMAKRLELRAYYETTSDLLPYKIHSFKMYLNRTGKSQLSADLMELQNNFVNMLHQLENSRTGDPKRSEQLLKRIMAKTKVAERPWLIEKARELSSQKR